MNRTVILTTLAGNTYGIEYTDYRDLSKKIHSIDADFHPSFQRLIRQDLEPVFPAGFGRQPELEDGEHVHLLMVNTVWGNVSPRYGDFSTKYVCNFGHHSNESGMWEFEFHSSDFRTYQDGNFQYDWDKLRCAIQQKIEELNIGWPEWQLHSVIDELVAKAKKKRF